MHHPNKPNAIHRRRRQLSDFDLPWRLDVFGDPGPQKRQEVAYGALGIGIQECHGRYIGRNAEDRQFSRNRGPRLRLDPAGKAQSSMSFKIGVPSTVFVDFTDNAQYDKRMGQLLRVLHDTPEHRPPPLGLPPSF
jgi:hypothetical protein